MRIRHLFSGTSSRATTVQDAAFLLRNQTGSFVTFYPDRQSRYEGWFLSDPRSVATGTGNFLKILERVELVGRDNQPLTVVGLTNTGSAAFWEYDEGTRLGWRLLAGQNGLTLAATKQVKFRLVLDVRGMYMEPGQRRSYEITQELGGYLVRYGDPLLDKPAYLHIRTKAALTPEDSWTEVAYPRDAARHSSPERLWTHSLGTIETDLLGLGAGRTAAEAMDASLAASRIRPQAPQIGISYSHDTLLNQTATAKVGARLGLRWLETEAGIWAGLPWFHQVWSRDELLAAQGLEPEEQREIIERYLGLPLDHGQLPTYAGSGTSCADGVGWLVLLTREYGQKNLTADTKLRLRHFLQRAHAELRACRTAAHGLIRSDYNATWMDTIGREGYRLEIQCMYALVLEQLFALTQDPAYQRERLSFLATLRQQFWHSTYLADGLGDPSIRPNVFLAYLLQPDLLAANQWQRCFDTALQALRLPWGGLSSLDTNDPRFQAHSTGQDNVSYQQGDSWFFVNNLAALAMQRFNARRYGKAVMGILQGSTDEILWHNFAGLPGEISSAQELASWGCGLQAFSAGSYLALLKELEDYSGQAAESSVSFWDSTAESTLDS